MSSNKRLRSASPSSSEETVAQCEDLILEILVRLPAKSLTRSQLVSRQWFNLISGSRFQQSHVRRNANKALSGLFFYDSLDERQSPEFVCLNKTDARPSLAFLNGLMDKNDRARIIQSRNGLLLYGFFTGFHNFNKLCVCNPTTRQYRWLPWPISEMPVCCFSLAFDPTISLHYKVVCTQYTSRSSSSLLRVHVYSSDEQCWRVHLEYVNVMEREFSDRIYWDGGLFWMGRQSYQFDLKSETLVKRERPGIHGVLHYSSGSVEECGVIGEHLYLLHCPHSGGEDDKVYVAEFGRDYSNWVIKYCLSVCDLTSEFPEIVTTKRMKNKQDTKYYQLCALGVMEGLEEEDSALVLLIPGRVISYNIKKKTVVTLCDLPHKPAGRLFDQRVVKAYQYVETLSSV